MSPCDTCRWWRVWRETASGTVGCCMHPKCPTAFYRREGKDGRDPREACPWHERGTDELD